MYFQVVVTPPPRPKLPKKIKIGSASTAPEIVTITLAPFTPNVKVLFEDIAVNSTALRQVIVRNPSVQNIEVNVTKLPTEDRQVQFNWAKIIISANSEEVLNIQWTPIKEGSWIDTITFEGGRRLRKDMQIVFKSINSNKTAKLKLPRAKKSPIAVVLKRIKSPIKQYTHKKTLSSSNKENELHISGIQKFSSPTSLTFNISDQGQFGRETYLVDKPKIVENNFSPRQCSTGKKSKNNLQTPEICFNLSSASTETYVVNNDLKNISSETYVKNLSDINLSAGTYVKANVSDIAEDSLERKSNSFEDSLHNLRATEMNRTTRPHYYHPISDSSLKRQLNLESSGVKGALQANPWSNKKLNDLATGSRKRKSDTVFAVSPIKKLTNSEIGKSKTWAKVGVARKVAKLSIQKPSVKELYTINKAESQMRVQRVEEHFLSSISALNSTSSALNPFVTATYIYDPQWLDEQEACFKRWFNVLLVPHSELKTYSESVDVARVWQQCLRKDVCKPPTKEEASHQYHVTTRLDALRRSAMELYRSEDVVGVLNRVLMYVASGRLEIRRDRSVHQDISLQYEVTRLFLSYNSLWLRIGLETVFGSIIPLRSNSDIIGLTLFIKDRVFKDNNLVRKYKSTLAPKYCVEIKKHILCKFLSFVFFLDQAKLRKLIPHDPCLFVKSGEFKESRDVLLHFAKEVIASIGDITRFLKPSKYILAYKQTYIHEFDYAVAYLASDLRDGVRLARIMEIILLQVGLTDMLRVPAISRLQKVHNVKVSFDALEKAGFRIMEDITPVDIVNGHKEKTLTLLWQIVNKFQVPRFTKAAVTIQGWFRTLNIVVKRRKLNRELAVKERAARVIQTWYRKHTSFVERRHTSAAVIQSFYRMFRVRKTYLTLRRFAILAQSKYRTLAANQRAVIKVQAFVKGYLARKRFLSLRAAVMVIEKRYIANKTMEVCRARYKCLKSAVIFVENKYLAVAARTEFLVKKQAVITIQRAVRAHKQRSDYLSLKNAAICLQNRFRANQLMKQQQKTYSELKTAAVNLQRRWRAKLCRANYLHKTACVITIQRYFRSYLIRVDYNKTKLIIVAMQRRFRANKVRKEYLRKREAAITIQQHFRARLNMLEQRRMFISLREAAVKIQSQYKARKERERYLCLKDCVLAMQRRFRAKKLANDYNKLKNTVVYLQRLYRANQLMKNYQNVKRASVVIQRRFRATMLMREQRLSFLQLVFSARVIQNYYKSYKATVKVRGEFCQLKESTINVQRRFRANRLMKLQRRDYLELLETARKVQRRFRAQLERRRYLLLKETAEKLQARFRAGKAMQLQRAEFLTLKQSVVITQRRYRANILMRQQITCFKHSLSCVVTIQRRYRAYRLTQQIRNDFCQLKETVISVQRRFRANKVRSDYLELLKRVKCVQERFRGRIKMRFDRQQFVQKRNAATKIQRYYKSQKIRTDYCHFRKSIVTIQRHFRASVMMKRQRCEYLKLVNAARIIQTRFRAIIQMRQVRDHYNTLLAVTKKLQMRYRAGKSMKAQQEQFLRLRRACVCIQQRFRANKRMRSDRFNYLQLKKVVLYVEAKILGRIQQHSYQLLRGTIIGVQTFSRGYLARIKYAYIFQEESREQRRKIAAARRIQASWRGFKTRSCDSEDVQKIQRVRRERKVTNNIVTLAEKQQDLLLGLVRYKYDMLKIINTFKDLNFIARHSRECCESLCALLPNELYATIIACTRSISDTEVIEQATRLLVTLYKHSPNTYQPQHLYAMLMVMNQFCDKEGHVFLNLATLFWLFAQDKKRRRDILAVPNLRLRLSKIKELTERKLKMVVKVPSSLKQSVFVNDPSRGVYLPYLFPDWGLNYPHRPHAFTNIKHALNTLLDMLSP